MIIFVYLQKNKYNEVMKQKISNYIADFLVSKGVTDVFMITGGGAMHLNDALGHHKELHCIFNHHEQASAIAADGYARLTNKIAALCVTSGPGGTNAITGVLGAYQDSIPMFVLSGQIKRETSVHACNRSLLEAEWNWHDNPYQGEDITLRQLGDQEFDITACVKNMTKYSAIILNPEDVRYHLEKAWFLANNGRKGSVWLDVPLDIQAAIVETDDLKGFDIETEMQKKVQYDKKLTTVILEKLAEAKRPVLFLGGGVRLAGATDAVLKVAEKLQIPVVTAFEGIDLMWEENPLYCGRPGTVGLRGGNFVVQKADLLIVLGSRLNIRQISYNWKSFAENAFKIIIDIDENELKKPTLKPDLPIHADLVDVVADLLKHEDTLPQTSPEWLNCCKNIHNRYPAYPTSYSKENKSDLLNPYQFVQEFTKALKDDDVMVCGNGSACVIPAQAAYIKKGQRLLINSACAAMGYAYPAAIGSAVARKGKRVICFDGDGSFQMNLQELQTVVHNNFNLKLIYLNNAGYHSMRQTQKNLFQPPLIGVSEDNGISFPDAEKIASAYGINFIRIQKIEEIPTLIEFINKDNTPAFCEIILDPNQNFEPKLSSKILPDGKIVSPPIQDLFPFLPRAEYDEVMAATPTPKPAHQG
jgi:acetolactate synthase-1/2/3 large subunit